MARTSLRSPPIEETPGAWPETPAESVTTTTTMPTTRPVESPQAIAPPLSSVVVPIEEEHYSSVPPATLHHHHSADRTAVPSPHGTSLGSSQGSEPVGREKAHAVRQFEPINPVQSAASARLTEDHLFKALSKRRTNASAGQDSLSTGDGHGGERAEIERLMSRMFGQGRQANSEEEKTRHVGLVFKHLTVKGMGLGAALQPTVGDILLGLPRLIKGIVTRGSKAAGGKPPIRTLLNDFNGCVRPGEMLLVLGQPGSGCSTFLKVLGNQRFGYKEVTGEVTYGGSSAQEMMKNFRGDVLYNPEDDLHYPTLTVKQTLTFALRTRTPGKASREAGESRSAYVREFLRVVSKLFWIEHTMGTKVGDAFIRGVSGGEKKR